MNVHNVYSYSVNVAGPFGHQLLSKGTLALSASHLFGPLLERLDEGDVVAFTAQFDESPILHTPPRLRLISLQCEQCRAWTSAKKGDKAALPPKKLSTNQLNAKGNLFGRLYDACKFLFNFLFAPLMHIDT